MNTSPRSFGLGIAVRDRINLHKWVGIPNIRDSTPFSGGNILDNHMTPSSTSYDVVEYPSYTHAQTHPDRLAVLGALFGLDPSPVTRCCVLELGCGNGGNVVPMAFGLPKSEFVGIDLAQNPVARGNQMIGELGLKNIQLIHGSVTEFDRSFGKFDYIIAHGLYSWVPSEVREKVMALCREFLTPHGIAFISYNALPGSHLRNMVRDMMRFHVQETQSPPERIRQAETLIQFIAAAQDTQDEYRLWMKSELETIRNHEAGHLFHDELAEISDPFYFTQFVQQAAKHGLKYLGEADYFEMFDHGFSEPTRATLRQLSDSRILREQYLDFLKCRRFRQTLLCHADAPIAAEPIAKKIPLFYVSSQARCTGEVNDLNPGKIMSYATPKGAKCATDFPLGKAALAVLGEEGLRPLAFAELLSCASAKLAATGVQFESHDPQGELAGFLLQLYSAGTIEFRTWLPASSHTASETPAVSALARWQIQHQTYVTSQFHACIQIQDEVGRLLLTALDGTLNRAALVEKVMDLLKSKNALIVKAGDETAARGMVERELQNNLEKLAGLGLLVG